MKQKQLYLSLFMLGIFSTANAALITTYTDRPTFDLATGVTVIEDFESYVVDTPFHTVTVDVGDFSLSMIGAPDTTYNFIDIAPPTTSESDVNGTTNMRVFTDDDLSADLVFTFDTPITAFGADLRSINDIINRTRLLVGADIIALPITASSGIFTFFGFTSDTAFTSITFEGLANDVYGIDNVTYGSAVVPVPAATWLFGSGLLGLIGVARRQKA